MAIKNYQTTVIFKELVAEKTYCIRFGFDPGEGFEFRAGQFVNLQVAENARRSYSLSSSPLTKEYIETYADTFAGGPGSQFFDRVQVGEKVSALGPLGNFTYEERDKPAYFIATGTGVTPFISMIRYALEVLKTKRQITLISGFRFLTTYFADEIFNELQGKYPNFKYYLTLTKPDESWKGMTGRVTEHLGLIKEQDADVYVCGSQAMINDVEAMAVNKGVPPDQIFYEQFY
jgi:ferredoxin-NADP reductase